MRTPLRSIGLDLDNTLIDYAPAFPHIAALLGISGPATRERLRVTLRGQDDEAWQEFQALLYTEGLEHALPAQDSVAFLQAAFDAQVEVSIVSHKTVATPARFGGRRLREPALAWLQRHGIVADLVIEERVRFCATRDEKVDVIRSAGFDWFVDDLLEVLDHPRFPLATRGWWYRPRPQDLDATADPQYEHERDAPSGRSAPADFADLLTHLRSERAAC